MNSTCLTLAIVLTSTHAWSQVTFEVIDPPEGATSFVPTALDFDGNTIAGNAVVMNNAVGARWVEGEGVTYLPVVSPTAFAVRPTGISASGEVIAGNYFDVEGELAFRWTPESGTREIPRLPSDLPGITALALSADGRVVVGGVRADGSTGTGSIVPFEPYRWTLSGGIELLPIPQSGVRRVCAHAVDAAGMRVAGEARQGFPSGTDGFVFEDGLPLVSLQSVLSANIYGVDYFSADGTTVVGTFAENNFGTETTAFLWTEAQGVEEIPLPNPGDFAVSDLSVSGDGQRVIGAYWRAGFEGQSLFVYDRGAATSVDLRDLLSTLGDPLIEDLDFSSGARISVDGRVIAGYASNGARGFGYRVVLEPASGAPVSTPFCTTQPANSSGAVASLEAAGTNQARLNALELVATNLPPETFGYFLASEVTTTGSTPAGSMGSLCLGDPLRGLLLSLMLSDASGTSRDFIDQQALPGSMPVVAGQTLSFQGWIRDVGPTSRFTTAASVTFE